VITGFNTDIEYQGVTYHVQTEDKGLKTPLILSLVYNRGTILASKRSAYDDLLIDNFDEKQLSDRLQKQHNLICAAIRAGRIEDLKRMMARDLASKQKTATQKQIESQIATKSPDEKLKVINPQVSEQSSYQKEIQSSDRLKDETASVVSSKTLINARNEFESFSKQIEEIIWDIPLSIIEEPIIEAVQIVEEEFILSGEAVEIITASPKKEQIADGKLKIRLLNDGKFKSGDRKTIAILVNRNGADSGLSGAQVMVKIIGSSFRPLIFHAQTDNNGVATVHLQLPVFKTGRAALLIKAMSEGEECDLRRVITQD
jgi:hypothetical protein